MTFLSCLWNYRTLQTAVGVFGGGDYTNNTGVVPLMVANAGDSDRDAISSLNSPPIVAMELCREHLVCFLNKEKESGVVVFQKKKTMFYRYPCITHLCQEE